MIHKNKDEFSEIVDSVSSATGFYAPLIEKDYYLTVILSRINELSDNLIFKGGTCLNKIYYSYYRLSEDLDFSVRLPEYKTTRSNRRKCIEPIKRNIEAFAKEFDMDIEGAEEAGRNESKQYIYYFSYNSAIQPTKQLIKIEIGLRFNPIHKVEKKVVRHKFLHPFTGKPLFDAGKVNCLSIYEIVSEKLRAAALRQKIAPRDFYDIDFLLRNGFNLIDKRVMKLFKKKLEEDGANKDLVKYRVNLGRFDDEIKDMRSRIKEELYDVLTPNERKNFDLDTALGRINKVMEKVK